MSIRRPPFKLKVNQQVAVQNPQKTSVRAKKSLKDIFCGTPCILQYKKNGPLRIKNGPLRIKNGPLRKKNGPLRKKNEMRHFVY